MTNPEDQQWSYPAYSGFDQQPAQDYPPTGTWYQDPPTSSYPVAPQVPFHFPEQSKPKISRPWVISIAAVAVTLVGFGVAVTVASTQDTVTSSSSSTLRPVPIAPVAPVLTDAQKVRAWFLPIQDQWQAIVPPLDAIQVAANANDLPALRSACGDLTENAVAFQSNLPAPLPNLSTQMNEALNEFTAAGIACQRLDDNSPSVADANLVADHLRAGTAHLKEAKAIIDGLK